MKTTILKTFLATFILIIAISSCTKDESVSSPPAPPGLKEANLSYAEGGAAFASVLNTTASGSSFEPT